MLRNLIGIALCGLAIFVILSLAGCSANVTGDLFWWKSAEPRTNMPWYGSVTGASNENGGKEASKGFTTIGK
tara:strand:+ start:560 stop:775 length:216 start_codon:yes stop_codon:yes gene_type:complete